MKTIKSVFCIIVLVILALTSCNNDESVYLSNRKFVRIDQSSLSLTVGERYKVTASADTLKGDSYKLTWSVLDTKVATVENTDDNAGIITAVAAGKTVIKVETADQRLMYFADLTVTGGEHALKILTIGSGIADDATSSYLQDIVKSAGKSLIIGNLFTEGASLEDHMNNITEGQSVYQYNRIGVDESVNTQNSQSLKSIVKSENWDYISFEESLPLSGKLEGYQTYLPQIVQYVKGLATNPDVKYVIHQPWAYAQNSTENAFTDYDRDQIKMFNAIVDATWNAKELAAIDIVVPSGTSIQNGRTSYIGEGMLRDDSYLNMNVGRFITACTWAEALFGIDVTAVSYKSDNLSNFDTRLAKEAAHTAVLNPKLVTELVDYKEKGPNEFILDCPIYIDFGPVVSDAPFNNYRYPTDPMLENLKDEKGNSTAFQLGVQGKFTGTLDRGLGNSLGLPQTASQDMFFCDGITISESSFKMSYLTKDRKYTFIFYGNINDNNTETEYEVIGKTSGSARLVNDYNGNRVAIVPNIAPADDGSIIIKLRPGPNNTHWAKFFGVNVMIIIPENYQFPGL